MFARGNMLRIQSLTSIFSDLVDFGVDDDIWSPLCHAAVQEAIEILERLLSLGAELSYEGLPGRIGSRGCMRSWVFRNGEVPGRDRSQNII